LVIELLQIQEDVSQLHFRIPLWFRMTHYSKEFPIGGHPFLSVVFTGKGVGEFSISLRNSELPDCHGAARGCP
jgi:hypothetical protein